MMGLIDAGIGPISAKVLLEEENAVLLDVRSPEEFAEGHLDGAINLDYSLVVTQAEGILTDKNKPVIVYCSAAKRSAQAAEALKKLGYSSVYNLGSMQNYYSQPSLTFSADTSRVLTKGDRIEVNYTASIYDNLKVMVSVGKDSTLRDAVPVADFVVPEYDGYYLTLKSYLVYNGKSYAEHESVFIYWSDDTIDTFATDLEWTKATTGYGSIGKNKSIAGNILNIAGQKFKHGIGTHATSEIVMDIPEGASKFLSVVGYDNEVYGDNGMIFYVYIDGRLADKSSLITIGQSYVFDIDIPEDSKEIALYVYEGIRDGNANDHADWAIAGFVNEVKSN